MTQEFIEAGKASELAPGTMKRVDIGGRRILLANVEGRLYAADDTCTHEDASLSTGFLNITNTPHLTDVVRLSDDYARKERD